MKSHIQYFGVKYASINFDNDNFKIDRHASIIYKDSSVCD